MLAKPNNPRLRGSHKAAEPYPSASKGLALLRVTILILAGTWGVQCGGRTASAPAPPAASRVHAAPGGGLATQGVPTAEPRPAGSTECSDGVDNDGDGLVDYELDPGCYGPRDRTERALSRQLEDGFTTWDFSKDSLVFYVSNAGRDSNDGRRPTSPLRTISEAASRVREGHHDFILLARGDTWRGETLARFKSGRDAEHPLVIASYGRAQTLPRVIVGDYFIDHNGKSRSFLALMDLHLILFRQDPADAEYDGQGSGLLRYVGEGEGLLVEGCHLEFGGIAVGGSKGKRYRAVSLRHNIVENYYHVGTCKEGDNRGSRRYRPSGVYVSHVDGLLMEGNLLDHNGWYEGVDSACATIYNHNAYISHSTDLTIVHNISTRPSSIHFKFRSDESDGMRNLSVQDNTMIEGEMGISVGGNRDLPGRFSTVRIERNVMSHLGSTRPTKRALAWGIEAKDTSHLTITENFFLNQFAEGVSNSYGLFIDGLSSAQTTVSDNLFYRLRSRALRVRNPGGHGATTIARNRFVDPSEHSRMIEHEGSLEPYTYRQNVYFSTRSSDDWFQLDKRALSWEAWAQATSDDSTSASSAPPYLDPQRSIATFAATIGLAPSLVGFLAAARLQTRLTWRDELTAARVNDYLRGGFLVPTSPTTSAAPP
jgi:hypothetical protein